MGELLDDLLLFIGVLPVLKQEFTTNLNRIKIEGETNYKKLENLIGKDIFLVDMHYGKIRGNLISVDDFDNYSVYTSKGIRKFHIHDLKLIN